MATAAVAIIEKARRRIFDALMGANAVSPDSAVEFQPSSFIQTRQFQRLQNSGVVHSTGEGRYWVDIPAYREWRNARRIRLGAAMLIVTAAAAAAGVFGATIAGIAG